MTDDNQVPNQAGAFIIEERPADKDGKRRGYLTYMCPCGCGDPGTLPIVYPPNTARDTHTWGWDGNMERPTLDPSIRRTVKCKFHGWLRVGVWSSAGDGAPVSPDCWRPPAPVVVTEASAPGVDAVYRCTNPHCGTEFPVNHALCPACVIPGQRGYALNRVIPA
jgi:hypothetical protein